MNPLHDRRERLCQKYGLSLDDWNRLHAATHGRCPMCRKLFGPGRLACVDHDHRSGLVRGLLCTDCNSAVGERHDDAGWFTRTGSYLLHGTALQENIIRYVPGSIGEHRAQSR